MRPRPRRSTWRGKAAITCLVAGGACLALAIPGDAATKGTITSTVDATIRNAPPGKGAGYVIGNALTARGSHRGVTFTQVAEKGEFRYGKVYGNVDFCGWVSTHVKLADTKSAPSPGCPGGADGRALRFEQFSNGLRNCEPGHCLNKRASFSRMQPDHTPQGDPVRGGGVNLPHRGFWLSGF